MPKTIPYSRHQDACMIIAGACNPRGVSRTMQDIMTRDNVNETDAAIRLMAHQLGTIFSNLRATREECALLTNLNRPFATDLGSLIHAMDVRSVEMRETNQGVIEDSEEAQKYAKIVCYRCKILDDQLPFEEWVKLHDECKEKGGSA